MIHNFHANLSYMQRLEVNISNLQARFLVEAHVNPDPETRSQSWNLSAL